MEMALPERDDLPLSALSAAGVRAKKGKNGGKHRGKGKT